MPGAPDAGRRSGAMEDEDSRCQFFRKRALRGQPTDRRHGLVRQLGVGQQLLQLLQLLDLAPVEHGQVRVQ
jgi:hypothetical protein